ncbi:MAG: lipopolysaccharide biosynthesis protein [Bacteroidetes bacterium]|nr:lipopolysaccharide biosynthesis protein [Bacteroidota bacterium]
MSLKRSAISSFFWTGLEQFGNQGISLIISIVLARILLPEDFGLIGMIMIFVGVGNSLMDAGLSQSLVRSKSLSNTDYSTVFYFNFIGSCLFYLMIFALAPLIADFYEKPILTSIVRWYCLVFVFNAIGNIQKVRIIKNLAFKLLFKITIPSIIIGGIIGITAAYNDFGVWSLVASALTQSIVNALLLWFFGKWKPSLEFSKTKFKEHFEYGYKLTLSSLLDVLYRNIYAVVIGKFFSVTELGFYTRADTLKQVPVQNIGAVLNKVTFPLFAKIQDDDEKLKRAYQKIMQTVMLFIAPLLLFSAALATPLFRFLLTDKWLPAVPFYQILCWAGVLYPLNAYNLNVLKVKGRSDLFLKLELIKKGIGVCIIAISISYGMKALLISAVITSVLAFFINSFYTGKLIQYNSISQVKDILPILVIATLVTGIIWWLDTNYGIFVAYDIVRLLVFGILGLGLYLLLISLFQKKILNEAITVFTHRK